MRELQGQAAYQTKNQGYSVPAQPKVAQLIVAEDDDKKERQPARTNPRRQPDPFQSASTLRMLGVVMVYDLHCAVNVDVLRASTWEARRISAWVWRMGTVMWRDVE
jgi:hypothetical protein